MLLSSFYQLSLPSHQYFHFFLVFVLSTTDSGPHHHMAPASPIAHITKTHKNSSVPSKDSLVFLPKVTLILQKIPAHPPSSPGCPKRHIEWTPKRIQKTPSTLSILYLNLLFPTGHPSIRPSIPPISIPVFLPPPMQHDPVSRQGDRQTNTIQHFVPRIHSKSSLKGGGYCRRNN